MNPYGSKTRERTGDMGKAYNWQGARSMQNPPIVGIPLERPDVQKQLNNPRPHPNLSTKVSPYQPPHRRVTQSEIEEGLRHCVFYVMKSTHLAINALINVC